ncbi:MAG: DNA mismatch repair protein MutS, partial [Anaerolineae bacterium]|nr:DNA mismatch repair protein MutS [Anaerolineae bacterium]
LVRRDVVRVITPGTVIEDALLRDGDENLLAALAVRRDGYGLATVDLSTGAFQSTEMSGPDAALHVWEELARLRPSEIVLAQSTHQDDALREKLESLGAARLSPLEDAAFVSDLAAERLRDHLGVATLEGFGCAGRPLATAAAGAALHYLRSNQVSDLAHIVSLSTYDLAAYMTLDEVTRRNLELTQTLRDGRRKGSLLDTLDRTLTAMGRRMLRRWLIQPLLDLEPIHARQAAVGELVEQAFGRADLRAALDGVYDVERLVGRVGLCSANARDLTALRSVLERLPRVRALLQTAEAVSLRRLRDALRVDDLLPLAGLIARAIVDEPPILLREGGLIRAGYDPELDRLRGVAGGGRDWLTEFEAQERARTGIKNLRVRYNQVFGFFIEVTKSNLHLVPAEYERRATVSNAERFVTPALRAREIEILDAEDRINALEYDLFVEVRQQIAARADVLVEAARALAELDTLGALAEAAALNGYVCPQVDRGDEIAICDGRHPVVEHALAQGERFVPNDTELTAEGRMMILTGPNMSGKSVYIRQVALIALLAQIGSFVPASAARLGLVDRILVRAGASDDITQGRSTFLVEMSETAYILRHATARSLVVLDEVGRGTSTYDGMSLAWAVAEDLHNTVGARTLFATHFHELTGLVDHLPSARNYTLAVAEQDGRVIFLRRLIAGGADRSYGIQVARLAGLPERVIERAGEVMKRLEKQSSAADEFRIVREASALREPGPVWAVEGAPGILPGIDEAALWAALRQLIQIDVANLTPVQVLVALNELQQRLLGLDRSE